MLQCEVRSDGMICELKMHFFIEIMIDHNLMNDNDSILLGWNFSTLLGCNDLPIGLENG